MQKLDRGLDGRLYRCGDAGYEEARLGAVWNERKFFPADHASTVGLGGFALGGGYGWNSRTFGPAWAHGALATMAPVSRGLQFSDNNLADRPDNGLSEVNQRRLEQIRPVFDPDHLFCTYTTPAESRTALALSRRHAHAPV